MSIFQLQKKQTPTDTKSTATPVINPDVLGKFGLTQEDVNTSYQNLEVENTKKEVAQQAIAYYSEIASGQISFADPKPIKLGEIAIKPQVKETSEVVDSLFDQVGKMEVAMNPEDLKNTKTYLSVFAENYGQKALEAKDWKTAVISYDLATEGGIIHAPQVLQNLNEIYKEDKDTRIKIVELIQQKIDATRNNIKNVAISATIPNTEAPHTYTSAETILQTPTPHPDNPIPVPPPHLETFSSNEATLPFEPQVQPVGTPTTPILGETTLRPAPPNPANHLP